MYIYTIAFFVVLTLLSIILMLKTRKSVPAGQSAENSLTPAEILYIWILCLIDPVLAGAVFYYGWRKKLPKKAHQANHISLWAFLIIVLVSIGFWMLPESKLGNQTINTQINTAGVQEKNNYIGTPPPVVEEIYNGEHVVENGDYYGHGFELFKKARLDIVFDNDHDSRACVFSEAELLKYKNNQNSVCLYEVIKSPDMVILEPGKYYFVVETMDKKVTYKLSLHATKLE